MTAGNVFGPILALPTIERLTMAHVRGWLPDYLRDVEAGVAFEPDGVTPLAPGSLPLPRSWRPTSGAVDKWPADQLPAVIFGSPGLGDPPARRAEGYEGGFVVTLSAVASGNDEASTRWLVGIYVAALRALLAQQSDVEGLPVEGLALEDEGYDDLPFSRSGSLMVGTVAFTMTLRDLVDPTTGPAAPSGDPAIDPGPWPEAETTELILERRPV